MLSHLGDVSKVSQADDVTDDGDPVEGVDGEVVGGQQAGDGLPAGQVVVDPVVAGAQGVQQEKAPTSNFW